MAPRLLYVDDEEALREIVQTHLALEGYDIETVAGGSEAIDILAKKRFDLVLLDLHMPKVDGLAVMRSMSKQGLETRIIVLSGDAEPAMLEQCAHLGAEDYLTKPYNFRELVVAIERVMAT